MPDPTIVVEPVVRHVEVAAPIDTCFRTFVDGFDTWWPREHHIGEDREVVEFRIEPKVGGRCYDVDTNGVECHWGTVLAHEPPRRLTFAWHIQADFMTIDHNPALQSEVEITFEPLGPDKTAVRLEHKHLERHAGGDGLRASVDSEGGWGILLNRFADVAEGRQPRPLLPAGGQG